MALETLSYKHSIVLSDVPSRWLPLIHLYDPDLPLFPIYYFHVTKPNLASGERPLASDRIFGYVERITPLDPSGIDVRVIINKDLKSSGNYDYIPALEEEVRSRFGVTDPVQLSDVTSAFRAPLDHANSVLREMWHRVVANAYGNLLPFGRTWDEVFGLARFVASWNSQAGRKGELIQTHYFATRFGVQVGSSAGIPQVDFFLLPTLNEILDIENPLAEFPEFRKLLSVAKIIATNYGVPRIVGSIKLTAFDKKVGGQFNTAQLHNIINSASIPHDLREVAIECFNAFGKGPARTILFLLMLNDLRAGLLSPLHFTSSQVGSIYDGLDGSYQSPKVIAIYAQQCFGNKEAMPVDTWIETIMKWPLNVYPATRTRSPMEYVFTHATGLGKVERLLWVTSQARKVHSSACDDALWCIKYGAAPQQPGTSTRNIAEPRGANPFSCNICLEAIRTSCPAFAAISQKIINFNDADGGGSFKITTEARNNSSPNQTFVKCSGESTYNDVIDEFSPSDDPSGFNRFPAAGHNGSPITVDEFVRIY